MRLRTRGAVASLAVGIIALALGIVPARAADDPALDQTVAADEEASTESAVIGTGHVDIGPRMVDGQWSVALRDDSGAHPVWRDPDRTVLRVSDAALMAAPTGSDYAFMGAQAGEQYYVVPQTQNPDVVWLGWNTQDPGVVSAIDRGATMRIGSVSGPGRTWMFLQDGTFGKPRLLVDGQSGQAQDVWVDASTHVHANWVFTAPGVYTAALTFSARTTDGQQLSASTTLRFAVGSQTSADEAFPWQPGMAFIKLKPGVNPSTRAATQSVTRAKVFDNTDVKVEQVFDMNNEYAALKRARGLDRWFVVKFDSTKNVEEVINELRRDPAIEKAHGNVQIAPSKEKYTAASRAPIPSNKLRPANNGTGPLNFSDPYLRYQWHYTTTVNEYGMFKPGADVNLFPAWQKETGNPHVVVAVMDSGVDFEHEDLAASAWQGVDKNTGQKIHGRNFYAAESGKGDPNVIVAGGHGTHVAGTIAARNNNGLGVCGVAGGNGSDDSGVRLMSCEIYGRDGTKETASTAYIVKAFEFAAENGASVCNCSWGYAFDRSKYLNNENFQSIFKAQFDLLKDGINYFTDYAGCDSKGNKKPESFHSGFFHHIGNRYSKTTSTRRASALLPLPSLSDGLRSSIWFSATPRPIKAFFTANARCLDNSSFSA